MSAQKIVEAMNIIGFIIDEGVCDEKDKLNEVWNILNKLVGTWPE